MSHFFLLPTITNLSMPQKQSRSNLSDPVLIVNLTWTCIICICSLFTLRASVVLVAPGQANQQPDKKYVNIHHISQPDHWLLFLEVFVIDRVYYNFLLCFLCNGALSVHDTDRYMKLLDLAGLSAVVCAAFYGILHLLTSALSLLSFSVG